MNPIHVGCNVGVTALALSRCLGSLLGFCGVRVAHLLCFCVMLFVLFLFVMCLGCPKLTVSLDYPFVISFRYSPTFIEALFFQNIHRYGVMMCHDKISYYISKMVYKGSKFRIFTYQIGSAILFTYYIWHYLYSIQTMYVVKFLVSCQYVRLKFPRHEMDETLSKMALNNKY